jgi:6,7-dimethyl-8-ribityllumazine synthase
MRPESQVSHMSSVIEGNLDASGLKFAVLCARFNSFITDRLLAGALDALKRSGAAEEDIEVVKVPGAWELPLAAKTVAGRKTGALTKVPDAIIALGAVIRGDTPHFDHVAGQASSGLAAVQLETGIPIAFGVLTTLSIEQAIDRAGGKSGNKGYDAAITAIEMAGLIRRLRK